MKIINIKLFAFAAAGLLALGSCKKDFLDVNTNPNNAEDVTVDLILPSAQGYLAYDVGLHFQIAGSFFSQYVTQGSAGSQYATYDQYRLSAVDFNRPWIDQYAGSLNDFEVIKAKSVIVLSDPKTSQGEKDKASNYAAIANLMQAYSFQVLADAYGDIPISAALKGQGNLSPKYDAQALVYDSLIKIVNRGISLIKDESDFHPGNDDLIYGGDMTAWKDFGNTLKLKIYLRQSGIRTDVARAGIEGMQAEGVSFLTTTAQVNFITTKFNTNPLYSNVASLGNFNLTASTTALDLFDSLADPRVQYFYVPASEGTFLGQFRGAVQGSLVNNTGAIQSASEFAQPSFNTGNAPVNASDEELEIAKAAPVILMSAAESYFLQAEAANAGFLTSPANEAYEAGIGGLCLQKIAFGCTHQYNWGCFGYF